MELSKQFYKDLKFEQKELARRKKERAEAAKQVAIQERKIKRRRETIRKSENVLIERIVRMRRYPSPRHAKELRAIAVDKRQPAQARALAAEAVLKWGTIGPVPDKPKSRRKGTRTSKDL